jgi:hypothetical protein
LWRGHIIGLRHISFWKERIGVASLRV